MERYMEFTLKKLNKTCNGYLYKIYNNTGEKVFLLTKNFGESLMINYAMLDKLISKYCIAIF